MVYNDLPEKVTYLDPHFCDNSNHPSPIARFEPTDEGWNNALNFCEWMLT